MSLLVSSVKWAWGRLAARQQEAFPFDLSPQKGRRSAEISISSFVPKQRQTSRNLEISNQRSFYDFNISKTTDQHIWFLKSCKNKKKKGN